MPKFEIDVCGTVDEFRTYEIEADTSVKAEELAMEEFKADLSYCSDVHAARVRRCS